MGFEKEDAEKKFNCVINEDRAVEVISATLYEYEHSDFGFFDGKKQVENLGVRNKIDFCK